MTTHSRPLRLSRGEIDDARWNGLLTASKQCSVYGMTWYLDVVSPQWEALVWPSADVYKVILPVPVIRKFGIKVVQQPMFCQFLGLFSEQILSLETIHAFFISLAKTYQYISSYHFNPDNYSTLASSGEWPDFQFSYARTHVLDLNRPYQQILEGYSQDRRINLKKAEASDWQEQDDLNPGFMLQLFRNNHELKINGGVRESSYELFSRLFQQVCRYSNTKLIYAVLGGEKHAGVALIEFGGRTIYIFNAASQEGRTGNARTWLLDNYFKANSETSLIFDFESPEVKSISDFYKSFGAEPLPFFKIHRNALPFPLNIIQKWRRNKRGR